MLEQQVREADLAERLGVQVSRIKRLLRLTQPCEADLIERAARALGQQIELPTTSGDGAS